MLGIDFNSSLVNGIKLRSIFKSCEAVCFLIFLNRFIFSFLEVPCFCEHYKFCIKGEGHWPQLFQN